MTYTNTFALTFNVNQMSWATVLLLHIQCIFPSWFRSFIGVLMAADILGWLHTNCRISCHLCLYKNLHNHKNKALFFIETNAKKGTSPQQWRITSSSIVPWKNFLLAQQQQQLYSHIRKMRLFNNKEEDVLKSRKNISSFPMFTKKRCNLH